MALDFTCLQTFQAKSRARFSSAVGGRLVTTFRSASCSGARVGVLHEHSAGDILQEPISAFAGINFHQAQIFLRGEFCLGGFVEAGRGDDFEEKFVPFLRRLRRRWGD